MERGRVRLRQRRAQPQQGISKASHGSQLDSSSAVLPGKVHELHKVNSHRGARGRTATWKAVKQRVSLYSREFWRLNELICAHKIRFLSFPQLHNTLKVFVSLRSKKTETKHCKV